MKKNIFKVITLCTMLLLCISFVSCQKAEPKTDLWANAMYTQDTELGSGEKTVAVEVTAEEKTVTLTIHSDKQNLGEALTEHNLIEGEQGAYGMYVKKVNGIEADYDKTKTYWGFNKDGESMMTGVDSEKIAHGDKYEIIYTKEVK